MYMGGYDIRFRFINLQNKLFQQFHLPRLNWNPRKEQNEFRCLALGYLIGTRRHARFLISARENATAAVAESLEIEKLANILEDFKMVLVVRNDLKMGKGKIAAQCSHATLGLYKKLLNKAPKALNRWEMCGQVKVVLKIESEEELLVLQKSAKSLKLPTHITVDAGRTQIAPNSRTVMAILGPADVVDEDAKPYRDWKAPG
ncbi:hypothetical protein NE237_031817 [Protea cynaroides]|uniref:peptidyl-tRNA hydrolase n=1 Tax=Protea cynaroides TaxID=273540 RepID=A0A9Q0R2H4_9MAGN|nr:hypothetical protein NE237_031817 [Protea cynaroides]